MTNTEISPVKGSFFLRDTVHIFTDIIPRDRVNNSEDRPRWSPDTLARQGYSAEERHRDFSRFDRGRGEGEKEEFILVDDEEVTIVACKDPRFRTRERRGERERKRERPKNFVPPRWRAKEEEGKGGRREGRALSVRIINFIVPRTLHRYSAVYSDILELNLVPATHFKALSRLLWFTGLYTCIVNSDIRDRAQLHPLETYSLRAWT